MELSHIRSSDTFSIDEGKPHAFKVIIATEGVATVLFLFKDDATDPLLRQALAQGDLHMFLVPPESP